MADLELTSINVKQNDGHLVDQERKLLEYVSNS